MSTAAVSGRAIAALLLAATIAAAEQSPEESLKQLSLGQLGNIEVTTASREPVAISRTPAAIHVITPDDIRRSGATSIPDLLRLVPGVEVARIDNVKWAVGIRGFGGRLSRSMLVVIDGRNVYSPLYAGVYWEVQDTLLQDVERIEIIRGPGATIWGPNAVNGVINIITKRAKDTHGALVSSGAGNTQGFVDLRYGGGNGRNLDYRVYGKAFTRGAQFHRDNKPFDEWQMGQGGFRMDWEANTRDSVTFQGDLYKGAIGERALLGTSTTSVPVQVEQDGQLWGGNLLGRWRRSLGSGSDIEVQTYYDRTNRSEPNLTEMRDTFDVDFLHHVHLARRNEVTWGAGARFSDGRLPPVVPAVTVTLANRVDKIFSAFAQDEILIAENRLWLTLGSKFVRTDFSGFDAEPSVRLLWTPHSRHSLWTAVTRAVRTPSDVEESLGEEYPPTDPRVVARLTPNRGFLPETLLGYEAGYRASLHPKVYLDIAAFRNRYGDLLSGEIGTPFVETSPAPAHAIVPISFGNGLYGSTTGFEITPNWRPTTWWQLDGSYSYLTMDLRKQASSTDASSIKSNEGSSPHHQIVVTSWFKLPKRVEFSQTFRYVSALPAQQVGSYTTANAWLSWRPAEHIELSLTGQNLLQPHHPEFGGDIGGLIGIKRSVYATVTWRQ